MVAPTNGHVNGYANGVSKTPDNTSLEQVLTGKAQVKALTQTLFSRDVDAAYTPPNGGLLEVPKQFWEAFKSQLSRLGPDAKLALDTIHTKLNGKLVNDKLYDLEGIIQVASSMPEGNRYLQQMSNTLVKKLWDDLEHPPMSYLGDEWRYRTMDGRNNSRLFPWLGQAGSPYARSVRPERELPPNLPDPGLLFDQLFARTGKPKEHPTKISSMLFYMATIIIHDVFRTESPDWDKVGNSSYLDLSPLYGNTDYADKSDEERRKLSVRTFENGLLKPDAYAEARLIGFPPGVSALLIMFNRFHNSTAQQLAVINEGGRFTLRDPATFTATERKKFGATEEGAKLKRDHDLFNTARLITCGLYVNIILIDYVRTILNLQKTDSEWYLNPRETPDWFVGNEGIPEGTGNQVSVEFNLVYRWHSTVSERDAAWTEALIQKIFKGEDMSHLTPAKMQAKLAQWFRQNIDPDPGKRVFEDGVARGPTGAFKDEDLINMVTSSTDDIAAAFGAHQVPTVLKLVEMLGMEQARKWNVATLNEFRKYFGLQPHANFEDINSDKDVAETLKTFYGDPDNVELYPGLVLEETKVPSTPGAGLCPGFTLSRAILSDAVALVRGDRFYTTDFNAASLTNWGFNFVQTDPTINGGGVIYKLFHRAFPGWYRSKSIYANYPFTEPKEMARALGAIGRKDWYTYDKPSFIGPPMPIFSWKAVTTVLDNQQTFRVPWGPHIKDMTSQKYECILGSDNPVLLKKRAAVDGAIYPKDWRAQVKALYLKSTEDMFKERSRKMGKGSKQIDIVSDIGNMSHAVAVAQLFSVPLQLPKDRSDTLLTAEQYYAVTSAIFAFVFLDLDAAASLKLKQVAAQGAEILEKIVNDGVHHAQGGFLESMKERFGWGVRNTDIAKDFGRAMVKRFIEINNGDTDVATWDLMSTMAAAVATQAQGFAQTIDFLFTDAYKDDWAAIQQLARADDDASYEKLRRYAMECLRLSSPASGVPRVVAADTTVQDGERSVDVKAGSVLFLDFVRANLDPTVYPDPEKMKLDRDEKLYVANGWGPHKCIGQQICIEALAAQLKVLGRLNNLRRAPGPQGQMKYVKQGEIKIYMQPDWSAFWPLPTTMKMLYDE